MNIYFFLCGLGIALQNTVKFWADTSCFKLKVKPWIGYIIYLSVTTAITYINLYYQLKYNNMIFFTSLLIFLFYFLPFYLLTEGNTLKKLIFFIIDQIVIDSVIEFSLYTVTSFFFDYRPVPGVFDHLRLICVAAFCLTSIPIRYITVKIWNKVNKTNNEKINIIFMIFPAGQIIAYVIFILGRYYSDRIKDKNSMLITSIYFIFLALSSVIYIIYISDVEKKNKLEREYNALNHKRQLDETRYSVIEQKQTETAKIRHDIKNQLIVINNLLSSGNSEEAAELLKALENSMNASEENKASADIPETLFSNYTDNHFNTR